MTVKGLVEIISGRAVLTRKDLAARYGKDVHTIDTWHRNGTLPPARYLPGCNWPFWRPTDIDENESQDRSLRKARNLAAG